MSFKDIAVWLEGAPEETSVANLAADLAGRLDAHAHAMTAWPDPAATLMWIGPGAAASLGPVIDFSDAAIFAMAIVNIIGLYALMPIVKRELNSYMSRLQSGEIKKFAKA